MKMKKTDSRIKEIQNAFKNFSLKLICIDIITVCLLRFPVFGLLSKEESMKIREII